MESLSRFIKKRRFTLITLIVLTILTYYIKYIPHFRFPIIGVQSYMGPMTILLPVNGLILGPTFGLAASILGIGLHLLLEPESGIIGPYSIIPNILATFTAGMLSRGRWKTPSFIFIGLLIAWYLLPVGRNAWNWPYLHIIIFGIAIALGGRLRSILGSLRGKMVVGLFIAALASLLVDSLSGSIISIIYFHIPAEIFKQRWDILFTPFSVEIITPFERISMAIAATTISTIFTFFLLATSAPLLNIVPTESYPEAFNNLWKESAAKCGEKGISRYVALNVIRLSYDCALKEEEGRPTSTGFIIGDDEKILKILPGTGKIILPKREMRDLKDYLSTLFGVVDGMSSSFIISREGKLVEVGLLWPHPEASFNASDLIAPRYRPYAYVTKLVDSLAFFSFGKLRVVKLFEDGSLIAETSFSWKDGKWVFRSFRRVVGKLGELAAEKRLNFDALCKCFSLAVEMSNRRLGGSFIIGDHETVLSQSEKPLFHFENANISDFEGEKEDYIINLASKEFATILDNEGGIIGTSTRLLAQVPSDRSVEVTYGDGGRHRSAAEMSATANKSIAIVISEDGPITVYSTGKRVMRI